MSSEEMHNHSDIKFDGFHPDIKFDGLNVMG